MTPTQLSRVSRNCWKSAKVEPRDSPKWIQGASLVVHPQQQNKRTGNVSGEVGGGGGGILMEMTQMHEQPQILRFRLDRMLKYKIQFQFTNLKSKEVSPRIKTMPAKGVEQHHNYVPAVSISNSESLVVVWGLMAMSQSNLLKLDRMHNEAMWVILYLLELPLMTTRLKMEQVNGYLDVI